MERMTAVLLTTKMMQADLFGDKLSGLSDNEALLVAKYLSYRIGTKDNIEELTELFALAGLTLPPQKKLV